MDTIVLVTVVPMLAPITIGTAPAKDKAPLLTIPTINEVVVDELWNKTVEKIPMNRATTGLLVVLNIDSATPAPMCFIADDIPLIPTRNKYRAATTPMIFTMVPVSSLFIHFSPQTLIYFSRNLLGFC